MIVRRRRLALLLATTLALAAGCTGDDDGGQTAGGGGQELKIGLLTPLVGPNTSAGREAQNGAQLAADVINGLNPSIPLPLASEAGLPNLGGAKVTIVTEDGAPNGDRTAQVVAGDAVNKLVSAENVDALIGAYDPQVTEYASQRSERYEVPFVNADSPATFLTDAGRDWFFRIGPSWRSAGEAFFSLLREQQTKDDKAIVGKVVVLHASDKAGQDVVTTVRRLADEGNLGTVQSFPFAPNAKDLSATVAAVRAAKPDTIFLYVTPGTVAPLVTAFATQQYKPKAAISFALGYLTASDFNSNPGPVEGLLRSVSWSTESADRNPAAQAVMALYQRIYNGEMTEAAASAFTAVMTVATAANRAGSTENRRLRSALLSLDVPGDETIMPWAGIRFDETHQNVLAQSMVEQYAKQAFKIVYPAEAAGTPLLYPAPGASNGPAPTG
jgi:branched-chain amino acid transport system substrate-binding protein